MLSDVVVLDPADHRGLRGPAPRHGKTKLFALGCRCDVCVEGDAARRAAAVKHVRKWAQANPERRREQIARYKAANREELRAKNRAYYHQQMADDPERVRARRRKAAKSPKGALANRLAAHKRRGAVPDREYAEIILRDPCSLCGARPVEIDHIDPVSVGGSGSWENLTALCRSCNASKNGSRLVLHLARSV